jgi:penicillin-binding protein 1A
VRSSFNEGLVPPPHDGRPSRVSTGTKALSDWLFRRAGRNRLIDWMGLDSWIDSSLAGAWERAKDRWNAASSYFARFRLFGWRRVANEIACEGLTLGAGGLVVLYALALPAFLEIDEGRWRDTGQFSVTLLDRDGNEIGKRGILHSDAVPLDEIPEHVIRATLATEDRRFFEHFGIDILGTLRALIENLRANSVVQGGSSLTQQLAKNLFLSSEKSLERKLKELFLAFWLESRLTKREILKLYLDRAYMGGGAFGVEAASQFYFGKSVRNVNMAEAAILGGLYKAPTTYAPHINLPAARARANEVLTNMVEAGFYTAAQVQEARLNPARIIETRANYSPDWYLDWAFEEVQRIAKGKGQFVLTARTTIDVPLQQKAEEALTTVVRQHAKSHNATSAALVSMEPDGAVRALVGGVDYGESQFNRATNARRQPGSSFKLYVYAAALEAGYTNRTLVRDSSASCGNWSPKNYNGGGGSGRRLTMQDAFKVSLNTTAVDLSLKVGREKVIELTERLGVEGVRRTCSMALGDTGITPLQHTGGYAAFANGGRLAKPYAILEIVNSKGDLVYSRTEHEPPAPQVLDSRVVADMNQMLKAVVDEGTGRRAGLDFTHAVGKTGTSSSYRDAWFMGFTGKYVTGVWFGNDDFRPMSRGGGGVTGGSLPATAWQAFNAVAHESRDFATIPGLTPHPEQVAARSQRGPDAGEGGEGERDSLARRGKALSDASRAVLERLVKDFVGAGARAPATDPRPRAELEAPAGTPGARRAAVLPASARGERVRP